MIRTILVPLGPDLRNETLLEGASCLGQTFKSHINAMFIRPEINDLRASFPELLSGTVGMYAELERLIEEKGVAERRLFEGWCSRNKISVVTRPPCDACSAIWSEPFGEIEDLITRYGRVSDLIVVQRPTTASVASQRCFDAAVFGSGRPTVILPEEPADSMTDHLLIAWNGSLEATRAVAAALPILHVARRVTIFTALEYDEEDSDLGNLAEALAWHGIRTPEVVFPNKGEDPADALLTAASKQGATMIAMGAYTHSRLRQRLLGGVTRHVLRYAQLPVLMSH